MENITCKTRLPLSPVSLPTHLFFTHLLLGGQFPVPQHASSPLLALRCAQAIRPYLFPDATSPTAVAVLIDAPLTWSRVANAVPIQLPSPPLPPLNVTVSVNDKPLTTGLVPLNATAHPLPFSLSALSPQSAPFNMSCTATFSPGDQVFSASAPFVYLPENPSGSVTKFDARTGALLARPPNGKGGQFSPLFPIGFYTQVDDYLAKDPTIPATLAQQGSVFVCSSILADALMIFRFTVVRCCFLPFFLLMKESRFILFQVEQQIKRLWIVYTARWQKQVFI